MLELSQSNVSSQVNHDDKTSRQENLLIDVLPYIDETPDEKIKLKIESLISDEMQSKKLPPVEDHLEELKFEFINQQWLDEMKKLQRQPEPAKFEEPDQNSSLEDWQRYIVNLKVEYEYLKNYYENLEILKNLGSESWIKHNSLLDSRCEQLEQVLAQVENEINNLNSKRKNEQTSVYSKIARYKEWVQIAKNNIKYDYENRQKQFDELTNSN